MRRFLHITGIFLLLIVVGNVCAQQATSRPLSASQEMELQVFSGQLGDADRSPKTKLEAAELLLTRDYQQAVDSLASFLADSGNVSAQVAVAEAIGRHGSSRGEFIGPLMGMLKSDDPAVQSAAARALASYKDTSVTEKLLDMVRDSGQAKNIRMVLISSLETMLDKRAVDTLVYLLDDNEITIRDEACEVLAKLTNIRAFGNDSLQWKSWWEKNKNKPRSEWLTDLADSLARAKSTLEADNARLRERLGQVLGDLYAATPPTQRDALLLTLLKDPLAEVRLAAENLLYRRINTSDKISPEIRQQVRALMTDTDVRIRESSAVMVATMGGPSALDALLERLKIEENTGVRQGLLTALGQLQDARALPAVLTEIGAQHEQTATAAATALARICQKSTIEGGVRSAAVKALIERYSRSAKDGPDVREALLTAMGVVRERAFLDVLHGALKDRWAAVRLAAVNGVAMIGGEGSSADIEPLVSDSDRGVRQAAIAALGTLGDTKHLHVLLSRTNPATENDGAVRQQAWDVVLGMLSLADEKTLQEVYSELSGRQDCSDQKIGVLQLLVEAQTTARSSQLADTQRQLGMALMEANRPAEAEVYLAGACDLYKSEKKPQAVETWQQWVRALLAAEAPEAIKTIAEQTEEKEFAEAVKSTSQCLSKLSADGKYASVVLLSDAAVEQLSSRLTAEQKQQFKALSLQAAADQRAADQRQVAKLVLQIRGSDETIRKAAATELQSLGSRAVRPLLEELKRNITSAKPDAEMEKAIVSVLTHVAPKMNGYNPSAALADRLKVIDSWLPTAR